MITLCGICISNYYNKVKLALLEKGIAFQEQYVATGSKDEAVLSCSPLGKVPFIRTEQGSLCESQAILDYLEALQPEPRLLPVDPWAAAKVRELTTFIDLHLELVTRELYGKAFFGGDISEANAARVRRQLEKNIAAFKRLWLEVVHIPEYSQGTWQVRALRGRRSVHAGGLLGLGQPAAGGHGHAHRLR